MPIRVNNRFCQDDVLMHFHSLSHKQARLLRIAVLQRMRRGSAAARGDGQVQRMARYSGTQVNKQDTQPIVTQARAGRVEL